MKCFLPQSHTINTAGLVTPEGITKPAVFYTRWCDDNAQKPMSANRVSSELAQNERLYNVEATNNVHVGGKRVRGFMGIEVVNPLPY